MCKTIEGYEIKIIHSSGLTKHYFKSGNCIEIVLKKISNSIISNPDIEYLLLEKTSIKKL